MSTAEGQSRAASKEVDSDGNLSCIQKISNVITGSIEKGFYRLGYIVGKSPWITVLVCLLLSGVCMVGFKEFQRESRGEELWIPPEAQALQDKEWIDKVFPAQSRSVSFLFQDSNVLTSSNIKKMFKIHQDVVNFAVMFENKTVSWDEICFKKGGLCLMTSLLELWSFDASKIANLTDSEILLVVNARRNESLSPYSGNAFNLERVVGDIQYSNGKIVGAKVLKNSYFYEAQLKYDSSSGAEVDERGEEWSTEFSKHMDEYDLLYFSETKSREISADTISGDVILLTSGYLLIFIYVFIMLGKFTRLEIKAWIALGGIISVGLSVAVSMALCSAFGFFYGPVHTILPFLLLGIGVDDLFVIVQSWANIPAAIHEQKDVPERIGLALKHAGSSITITTATDMLAFFVGASTIIPGLRSFCFYAAIGILCDYLLQVTFFVAWLAIDARRTDVRRDGCCFCITLPSDYKPNDSCGEKNLLQTFFAKHFSKLVLSTPAKILIIAVVLGLLGVNIYGTTQLRQQFEPKWFQPKGTVIRDYYDLTEEAFPDSGMPLGIYSGSIDYHKEQKNLHKLTNILKNEEKFLSPNSVNSWYEKFILWTNTSFPQDLDNGGQVIQSKEKFYSNLKAFLKDPAGQKFSPDVKWKKNGTEIEGTRIQVVMKVLTETKDQVDAMDTLREDTAEAGLSSDPIVYNRIILFSESNKVIQEELYRNILLALIVVLIVTFIIIASPVTSFFVFLCVVFTVVDVAGLMYFWDLTIDTVSVVVLIIAVGLSVDYASHVGHTFLVKCGTRTERATKMYRDIGPAVWNGGFSTFLAVLPLATSESHVFITFFRILFGVVIFGVFHGIVFLPVILSIAGPSPYQSARQMESTSKEAGLGKIEEDKNGRTQAVSPTNGEVAEKKDVPANNNAGFAMNELDGGEKPGHQFSNGDANPHLKSGFVELSL